VEVGYWIFPGTPQTASKLADGENAAGAAHSTTQSVWGGASEEAWGAGSSRWEGVSVLPFPVGTQGL